MKPQRGKTPGRKTPASKRANKQTDPVQVYSRIRPLDDPGLPTCVKVLSPTTISVTPGPNSHAVRTGFIKESQYTFEYVFDEYTSQKAIFEQIALPLVEDVLHGKNALLFAYGVTSSGKTHTMTGSPQDQGVLPRCMDVIFNSINTVQSKKYVFKPDKMNGYDVQTEADAMLERQRRDIMPKLTTMDAPKTPRSERFDASNLPRVRETSRVEDMEEDNNYSVFVSYVEIYNNYIYDLLEELQYDPITGYKPPTSKLLREDGCRNMYVSNISEVEVKSTEEAYEVLWKGQKRRKVAHTTLNTSSSRSHSVFNIRLVQAPLDPRGEEVLQDKDKICVSQLSLVDLAGSERLGRTGNVGDRLKEAGNINQSLMVLRTCIEALRENQKSNTNTKMVPYRDSRLTHLFKNYFDGEGKVRMIVCVNPLEDEYDETIQVMKFAELTQEVQVNRQQQVRFDTGLTPGRRRLNMRYKEAVTKAQMNGDDPNVIPVPEPMVYSMGAPFPPLELVDPADDVTLATLMDYLKRRENKRMTLLGDLSTKEDLFRKRLLDIERQNTELRMENDSLRSKLGSHDTEVTKISRRVRSLEKANEALQRTTTMYEQERRGLERELDDKEYKIRKVQSDKDRLQHDYHTKLVITEHEHSRMLESAKRKLKNETASVLRAKQQKLEILRNIINDSDADSVTSSQSSSSTPVPRPRARTVTSRYLAATASSSGSGILPAKSEPDLSSLGSGSSGSRSARATPASTPLHQRAQTAVPHSQPVSRGVPRTTRARSPPPIKPKPAMNPRYNHRRSKSSGDVWLDHKPVATIDTGTILQPNIKRKKSVTRLTEKNTKEASKYLLTHQELDSDGDLATKLVKGSIVPTVSGGSAVVFEDVETIKQTSPGDRKRRSPPLHPEDFEGEWTDTEDRCRIAVEGHGHLKRVKTSVV